MVISSRSPAAFTGKVSRRSLLAGSRRSRLFAFAPDEGRGWAPILQRGLERWTMKSDSPARLTPAQLSTLRERLQVERARLRGGADETLAPVREPRERSADEMDEAEESLAEHEALGLAAHDRARLVLVERALEKIEAKTYGVSELSGEPIGYARLEAVPWAHLTAAEQEDAERMTRR